MKKLLIICAAFAVTFSTAYCDSRSDGLLSSLSSKIAAMGSYRVDFTATMDGQNFNGSYAVAGNKYFIKVGEGMVISDGSNRYEINMVSREILVDKVDPADRNILTNPTKAFEFISGFRHQFAGERTVGGKPRDIIKIQPSDSYSSFRDIVLEIDRTSGLPAVISYRFGDSSDEVRVSIDSFRPDASIPASTFVFDRSGWTGYEIIDFR